MELSMQPHSYKQVISKTNRRQDDHLQELSGCFKALVENLLQMPKLNITRTCTVKNDHMKAMYELKVAEYVAKHGAAAVQQRTMFYTTHAIHAYQVAKHNFNWRISRSCEFGNGVAFSSDAIYSNYLCPKIAEDMAIIVVKVVIAKTCRGYSFMDFPMRDCDTTCDLKGRVFVKFHDHEFLPVHVVFFDGSDVQSNHANHQQAPDNTFKQTSKDRTGRMRLNSKSDSFGL